MSNKITISKILPGGRTVRRKVDITEYLNDGWATNGWATNGLQEQMLADKAIQNTAFNKTFASVPTDQLRKYPVNITITKTLPGGRTVRRSMTYGEYVTKGWATNGWINRERRQLTLAGKEQLGRPAIIARLKQQKWWKPKRSFSQASMLYMGDPNDPKRGQYIEKLRDLDYVPNPRFIEHGYSRKNTPIARREDVRREAFRMADKRKTWIGQWKPYLWYREERDYPRYTFRGRQIVH